jgi:hypothetical protein
LHLPFLINAIVIQSLDVVDSPELRDLLIFISTLDDGDIPHRSKLSELITKAFKKEYMEMTTEIEVTASPFYSISCFDIRRNTHVNFY